MRGKMPDHERAAPRAGLNFPAPSATRPFVQPGWFLPPHALGLEGIIALAALVGGSALFLRPMWSGPAGTEKIVACWALLGIVAAGVLWWRFRFEWLVFLVKCMPAVVVVTLWALISAVWSLEPVYSAERALWLLSTTLVGIGLGYARGPKFTMALTFWMFAFVVIASLVAVVAFPDFGVSNSQWRGVIPIGYQGGEWRGIFLNKNELGDLASGATVFFAIATLYGRIETITGLSLAMLSVLMVIMSGSATAFALLAFSLLVIAIFFFGKMLKATNLTMVIAAIVAIPLFVLILNKFDEFTGQLNRDPTMTTRVQIWRDALDVIQDRPVIGYGYRAVWLGSDRTWFPMLSSTTVVGEAHNGYLQLAADLGIPISLVATLFIIRIAALGFNMYALRSSSFAFFCFVYSCWFIIFNISETRMFQFRRLDWVIFVAIAVCLVQSVTPSRADGRRR